MRRSTARRVFALAAALTLVAGLPAGAFAAQPASGPAPACDGACPLMAAAKKAHSPAGHEGAAGGCLDAPRPAFDCCDAPAAPPPAPAGDTAPPSPERSAVAPASGASLLASVPAAPSRRASAGPPRAAPAPDLYTLHAALLI